MKKMLLVCVLIFTTLFTSVWAEDNPRAVIIFDASGSMWGQINGVTKIEIARDALKNVVKEWNPNVELGLTVYGHRSKGDCNDIETVIPVGKIDKNRVIKTVMGIKPKGKTPISRSLRKVAEEIKYTEEKATIILISDGKETCDPDPCGTAKELEKQGIDFVTHVIGFNVDKKTSQQLECIASATGGEYFSAKNAAALNEAMKVIAKKVEVVEPKPEPKPIVVMPKNNLEVTASEKKDGKMIKVRHYIYRAINGEREKDEIKSCFSYVKKPCLEKLPAGNYVLRSKYEYFKDQFTVFDVTDTNVTKMHIIMGETGTVEFSVSEEENGKWVRATHYTHRMIDGDMDKDEIGSCWSKEKKPCTYQFPVGKYVVRTKYNKFEDKKTYFEVKAEDTTKVHVVMGETGTVEFSVSEEENGKWVRATHYTHRMIDGDMDKDEIGSCWSKEKKPCTYQFPVGKYVVRTKYNEFDIKKTYFEVKAKETTKVHVAMGTTGEIEISASEKEGGKWVRSSHYVYKMEDGEKNKSHSASCTSTKKKACLKKLPVGQYVIESTYNGSKKVTPLEIKTKSKTKVHVTFGQFMIEAKCSEMNAKVNYEIYASNGQLVDEKKMKCSDTLKVTLDNGDYSVEAKVGNDTKEVKFTVGGGSNKLLIDMTDIKREPTKEELIKADSVEAEVTPAPKQKEQKSEKIMIGGKQIEIKGISQKDADKIKELGAMLGAFGGMIQGVNPEEQKKQEEKQSADNAKADKEFDEMSKDLDMFTK